jgi:phage repressor protein C with HTH and peptisase S24 domain
MSKVERLNEAYNYLKFKGIIGTQKDVAVAMNSTQPNVSSALKGDEKVLTDNFLVRFSSAYEDISSSWLLTGEGEMLSSEQPVQYDIDTAAELIQRGVELIPMYSEPFRAGNVGATFSAPDAQVESYWAIPGIKAQQVISVTGDSMEPTILRGASVAIAPMHFQLDEPFAIPFGEVFAIVLHDPDAPSDTVTSYVKRLYRHPSTDKQQTHWMAHSDNPRYEDFEICIANITSLWRVLAGVHYYA